MPRLTDSIALADPFLKRNVKILPCQREMIPFMYARGGCSQRSLARMYQCSRRLITFILDPQKKVKDLENRRVRGGSVIYYNKEKHTKAIREHRDYKKEVFNKNK